MDFFKVLKIVTLVNALVELYKKAKADGKLSAGEVYEIFVVGVGPILELFGEKLPEGVSKKPYWEEAMNAAILMEIKK